MSLTLTNHVHGALYVVVDATANNSSCVFIMFFFRSIGRCLLGPDAPYLLVVFFFIFNYLVHSNINLDREFDQ